MRNPVNDPITALAAVVALCAIFLFTTSAPEPVQAQTNLPGTQFVCSADDIGATLTRLTGCIAPDPPFRRYVTDIIAQSTTTTAGQFILRTGTSTLTGGSANCASSTASLFPSAATAVRLGYPANTAAPTVIRFNTPLIVDKNKDLCVLGVATNTVSIQVIGYVAP